MGRLIACGLVAVVVLLAARGPLRDDDRLVDPSTPAARQAIAIATEVVPGSWSTSGATRTTASGR